MLFMQCHEHTGMPYKMLALLMFAADEAMLYADQSYMLYGQ